MITLKELLNSIKDESKEALVKIDDWRFPDIDHLINMGFEFSDDYRLKTPKPPNIIIYKKKEKDIKTGKAEEVFYVEEESKEKKRFTSFYDIIDFFDRFEQPEIDKHK